MLYRKFGKEIEDFLRSEPSKIMLLNGARQIGKTFIIRHVAKQMFENYVEINLQEDSETSRLFANVNGVEDFYIKLSMIAGNKLGAKNNTIVFLDEIQVYPRLLTLLKFLNQDSKYSYIASGSQLGIALMNTPSIPMSDERAALRNMIAMTKMYCITASLYRRRK